MAKLLLSLHVLAGIIFIGPVTVAVSLFPRYARLATEEGRRAATLPILRLLRRISTAYAVFGLSVPVLGVGVAVQLGVLTDAWLVVSIAITIAAAALLALGVLPKQGRMLAALTGSPAARTHDPLDPAWDGATRRLAMTSGMFALMWAIVVVLMIVRPGSTTGV